MRALTLALALLAGAASAELVIVPAQTHVGGNCEDRTITWTQPDAEPVAYWDVEWRRVFTVGAALRYELAAVARRVIFADGPALTVRVRQSGLYAVRVRACFADGAAPCSAWSDSTDPASVIDGAPFLVFLYVCPPTGGINPTP